MRIIAAIILIFLGHLVQAQNSGTIGTGLSRETITYFTNEGDSIGIELSNSGDTLRAFASGGGGGGTDDQALTRSNDTIYLEDGGFVVLPDTTGGIDSIYRSPQNFTVGDSSSETSITLEIAKNRTGTGNAYLNFHGETGAVPGAFIQYAGTTENWIFNHGGTGDYSWRSNSLPGMTMEGDGEMYFDQYTTGRFQNQNPTTFLTINDGTGNIERTSASSYFEADSITWFDYKGDSLGIEISGSGDTAFVSNTDDQALSRSNDTIYLEDGGFVVLPDTSLGPVHADTEIVFGDGSTAGGVTDNTFVYDDANGRLGIGTNSPSTELHITDATDPKFRIGENALSDSTYFQIDQYDPAATAINHYGTTGAGIDFNPVPGTGSGNSYFRFFRNVNTTGHVYFDVNTGKNSSNANARFSGGNTLHSYINGHYTSLNFGVGTNSPQSTLHVGGVVTIENATAPSGDANATQLFSEDVSSSSELKVRDESGNTTTLSPHNFSLIGERSHEMAWAFYSEKELPSGEKIAINVDMFRVVQLLEELTGEKLIHIKSIK